MDESRPTRPSSRTPEILAAMIEPNRAEEDGVYCISGSPTLDIPPEAQHELQRTISEVARCVDGNDRLSTICTRYVETLNAKHHLAAQLREEQALRTKVLETKNRLVTVCKRLQEQSTELRREHCCDENETKPVEDRVALRTHLGLVRKYIDLEKFVGQGRDGEDGMKNHKGTWLKTRSFKDVSTETEDAEVNGKKSLESLLRVGKSDETQLKTPMRASLESFLSEGSKIASEEEVRKPRVGHLSVVKVTQTDIPPTDRGCKTGRIGMSWASTDLTRR